MHNPVRPLQSAMGLAREIRLKIQRASAAQLFPVMNAFARSLRTALTVMKASFA
jgi:hypothetical protein